MKKSTKNNQVRFIDKLKIDKKLVKVNRVWLGNGYIIFHSCMTADYLSYYPETPSNQLKIIMEDIDLKDSVKYCVKSEYEKAKRDKEKGVTDVMFQDTFARYYIEINQYIQCLKLLDGGFCVANVTYCNHTGCHSALLLTDCETTIITTLLDKQDKI